MVTRSVRLPDELGKRLEHEVDLSSRVAAQMAEIQPFAGRKSTTPERHTSRWNPCSWTGAARAGHLVESKIARFGPSGFRLPASPSATP
jgi:hypothetical protein